MKDVGTDIKNIISLQKAMYPHLILTLNVGKDVKKSTVVKIDGFDHTAVNDFFGHYTSPVENSVYLCNKYFELPDYDELDRLFEAERTDIVEV